jgi:toxin ParE1/3/4
MAQRVVWSFEAASDLEALAQFIAKDSAFYAAGFVQGVLDAGRSLKEFSERGRIVPEFANPSIRELFVREYRLIYTIEASRVVILGLIHGRRDLNKLWRERKRG